MEIIHCGITDATISGEHYCPNQPCIKVFSFRSENTAWHRVSNGAVLKIQRILIQSNCNQVFLLSHPVPFVLKFCTWCQQLVIFHTLSQASCFVPSMLCYFCAISSAFVSTQCLYSLFSYIWSPFLLFRVSICEAILAASWFPLQFPSLNSSPLLASISLPAHAVSVCLDGCFFF